MTEEEIKKRLERINELISIVKTVWDEWLNISIQSCDDNTVYYIDHRREEWCREFNRLRQEERILNEILSANTTT